MTAVGSASQTFGLLLGGVVADAFGWRWLFLGPAPLLAVLQLLTAALIWRPHLLGFPEDSEHQDEQGSSTKTSKANTTKKTRGPVLSRGQVTELLKKFDWRGSVLFTALAAALLLVINRAPSAVDERRRGYVSGSSPSSSSCSATVLVVLCALALPPLALLLWREERDHAQPIVVS